MRVGDQSRQHAASLLSEHYAAGRLSVDELESRLTTTWQATTRDELGSVVADLPDITRRLTRNRMAQTAVWIHATVYAAVMLLLVLIWLLSGADYPWPIWPALGWGSGLFAHAATTRGRHRPKAS